MSAGRRDDADLVADLRREKPAAVAELYDRFAPRVRRLLVRVLGTDHDVEDVMQEAFLVVVRRAPDIQEPDKLASFVTGVTIRTARNELRKRAVRRFVGLDDEHDPPIVAGHDAVSAERVRHVYRALDRLDSGARVLFLLRHTEGLELARLAEIENCSLATVKRRLARAQKRFRAIARRDPVLREYLEQTEGSEA